MKLFRQGDFAVLRVLMLDIHVWRDGSWVIEFGHLIVGINGRAIKF